MNMERGFDASKFAKQMNPDKPQDMKFSLTPGEIQRVMAAVQEEMKMKEDGHTMKTRIDGKPVIVTKRFTEGLGAEFEVKLDTSADEQAATQEQPPEEELRLAA